MPWYYAVGSQQQGPVTEQQLQALAKDGVITGDTLVWREGMTGWQAWRAVGGFDESFVSYCEDVDLGFRLRLAGGVCVQAARARVRHVGGGAGGGRSHYAVFHGTRNRMWTYFKNMPGPLLWLSLPAHLAATLAFLVVSPFRGTGAATWAGVGAGLAGLGRVWRARGRQRAARRASLADVAASLSWRPDALLKRAPCVRRRR